ncbi:MAG: hypothetical protein DRO40_02525 [Thermoprotei archaeon]|nr:MAG: hypothetical protein DRO40_02525 [Thermoprotei archaeon]
MKQWVSARDLDALVWELDSRGIEASRHAYSYRLLYKGMLIASIHVYPGYKEISLRLYKFMKELAKEAYPRIIDSIKKCFPEYKVIVKWYPP